MITTTQKTDSEIKTDVLSELKFEPSVNVNDIGVLVHEGTVTLTGLTTSYGEKWDTVNAVKRIAGVKAIADNIEVKLPESLRRTDGDIAAAAASQVNWPTTPKADEIGITVREGWITLEGEVEWWFRKDAAESAVRRLPGVKGVINRVIVKPRVTAREVKNDIEAAFGRSAVVDSKRIHVETKGSAVTLSGTVRNHAEREEAERVAWAAPGVFSVHNDLSVDWSWFGE